MRYFEVLQGNFVHLNISGLSFGYLGDILRDSLTEFVQSAKCAKAGVKKSKRLVPVTFSLLVLDLLENSNSNIGARFHAFCSFQGSTLLNAGAPHAIQFHGKLSQYVWRFLILLFYISLQNNVRGSTYFLQDY